METNLTEKELREKELRQLFKDRSDCYADTWQFNEGEPPIEGEVEQAITENRFIEILAEAKLFPVVQLPIVSIDPEVLRLCIEMYKSGDIITAIKWLLEEARKDVYNFNINWAKNYLEKQ